mmetsp:Transcript_50823/g.128178  ORF Transcript_50823/g.128178 Transcript_50823/m.128178 type:complete len:362 (-) Transcript_50823:27-1112(-)
MDQRAGDWQCPNPQCLNHHKFVFGTKTHCPKCGCAPGEVIQGSVSVKAEAGMQGGDMASDWSCPNTNCINHTKFVFGKNPACPKCGTARNAKMPGDWRCPNAKCANHTNTVFASKVTCPKCGSPRPGGMGQAMGKLPQAAFGGITPMMQQAQPGRLGDWQCPNASCMNNAKMVFGKYDSCPKCGSPKPAGGPNLGEALGALLKGIGVNVGNVGLGGINLGGGVQQVQQGQNGDWQCPNASCMNHTKMVFGKNASCPKCGSPKPSGAPMTGGALGALMQGIGLNVGGGRPTQSRGGSNPGDWRCPNPNCVNNRKLVFAKHQACQQCGAEKPMVGYDDGGADRSRSPHRNSQMMSMGAEGWTY